MNRDYAESYEEHKSGKYEYVKGFGRLGCYQGLDYIENILKNDKYYSEELEDNFIFIKSYINYIEYQCKKQKEVIDKAIEYISNKKAIINTDVIRIFDLFEIDEQGYTNKLLDILKEAK